MPEGHERREPPERPAVALAYYAGIEPPPFDGAQLERLAGFADLLDPEPLTDLRGERATTVLADTDVLLGHWGCPPLDADALARAPHLRTLAYAAGTVKFALTPAVWEREILVTSAAVANAQPVAEFTLAAILLANKGAFLRRDLMRRPEADLPERADMLPGNRSKQVGIVGASHVGRHLLRLLEPYDLTTVVADPYLTEDAAASLGTRVVDLDELLATSHVVTIHAPELPETRHMIGADQLRLMADGATLINTARGSIVDTDALEAELVSGRLSAVLDVTDPEPLPRTSPLYELPNVFLTPHLAGSQGTEVGRMADLALDEVERFAAGRPPLHPVREQDLGRIA